MKITFCIQNIVLTILIVIAYEKTNEKVVGSKAAANMVASNVANHENAIRVMVFECSEFGCIRILTDEKGEPQFAEMTCAKLLDMTRPAKLSCAM